MAKKKSRRASPVKLCGEKVLPPSKVAAASRRALKENPANVPAIGRIPGPSGGPTRPARMALLTGKRWAPGRKLTISFMGGSSKIRSKIQDQAIKWLEFANLEFEFKQSSSAEIRIGFDRNDGSWSYLGTDNLSIRKSEQTMNFGWLFDDTSVTEYSRVVLHEFGHMMACIHEHSHPEQGIPWDKEKVYAYYKRTNGWSRADVDAQVFARYSANETNFSEFDPSSIMLYAVPNELTVGNFSVGWNTNLSAQDKAFIERMYPKATPTGIPVEIDGSPVAESIGQAGDEDLFSFMVGNPGQYRIETTGTSDVTLLVMGPDSETDVIGEDDDGGWGRNPRLDLFLWPGTYFARIRHYWKTGKGNYKFKVTSR